MVNVLTLDIEDWSQSVPDLFGPGRAGPRPIVMPGQRVVTNTQRLLEILAAYNVRATCFVLGSVAERFPGLVRDIHAAGHEVASHGFAHQPVYTLTPDEFLTDVRRAVAAIEDAIGERVRGYRAPYFSITRRSRWALRVLARLGLAYDASIFPVHRRYYPFPDWDGWPNAQRFPHVIAAGSLRLVEVPVTTARVLGQNLPFAGGALLRMVPFAWLKAGVEAANKAGYPAVFYLHPHDLDAEELRSPLPNETLRMRLTRWALNLGRRGNAQRLGHLLGELPFGSIHQWLATRHDLSAEAKATAVGAGDASGS